MKIYHDTERDAVITEKELRAIYDADADARRYYESFSAYAGACMAHNNGTLRRVDTSAEAAADIARALRMIGIDADAVTLYDAGDAADDITRRAWEYVDNSDDASAAAYNVAEKADIYFRARRAEKAAARG